jgi:iron complex outermembrane receptor protein
MYKQAVAMHFALCCWPSIAQECQLTLKGTVNDYHNGMPLELATIYVQELERSFYTSQDGSYRIGNLCPGTYTLFLSHVECESKSVKIELETKTVRNFLLEHHSLEEIRVVAQVDENARTSGAAVSVEKEVIENYSGASLGDALATAPGVTKLKTGNSIIKPVIQGLYGSRVVIVNNGTRLQDQEWGVEHAPNVDVNSANDIRILKGGNALRYGGDAIGGVVEINRSRVVKKDTLHGRVIAMGQTNNLGGSITGSVDNYRETGWYQRATVSYKKYGDFEAPDYVLSNTGSETAGVNIDLGFKKFEYGGAIEYSYFDTEIGILRAAHIGNARDLAQAINSGVPNVVRDFTFDIDVPRQDVVHSTTRLSGYYRIPRIGKLSAEYSYQTNNRKEFDVRRNAEREQRPAMDMELTTHFAALRLEFDAANSFSFEVGLDGISQVNFPSAETGVRRLIPDYEAARAGVYANFNYRSGDWLFDGGARYDYYKIDAQKYYITSRWQSLGFDQQFPQFERFTISNQIFTEPSLDYNLIAATLGAKYFIEKNLDVSGNLSLSSRAPNPSELFSEGLHHSLARIELGQLDIEQEQALKLQTVLSYQNTSLQLSVNPYVSYVLGYIQLIPGGAETTIRGAFPVWDYVQNDALLYGLDLGGSYTFRKSDSPDPLAHLQSSFAYVRGQDLDNEIPLIDIPPFQFTNQITFYDILSPGLNLFVTNETVFEQTRFPNNDFTINAATVDGNREDLLVEISQPPAAYSLWGGGVEYAFAKAKIRLTTQNLFNTRYRNYLNALRFFADDVGRNFQLQVIYKF